MIDVTTPRLNLPIPNVDNFLEDDVGRLEQSLKILDDAALVGSDGVLPSDLLPKKLVYVGEDGKIPKDAIPALALQSYPVSNLPSVNVSTGNGYLILVTDGDAGNPCLAVSISGIWRRIALGSAVSST